MQRPFSDTLLESILREWLEPLGNIQVCPHTASAGLSGAGVWQVFSGNNKYCLKCWPAKRFPQQDLELWHKLLEHVYQVGFQKLPRPSVTRSGATAVHAEELLWDLTNWLPGAPYTRQECDEVKLGAMLGSLAEFHLAAATFQSSRVDRSPGLQKRREIVQKHALRLDELQSVLAAERSHPWQSLLRDLLTETTRVAPTIVRRLYDAAELRLPMQWCLRDVKFDHMLFENNQVSGLVDYGAAAVDSVGGGIARLVGSTIGDRIEDWEPLLANYEAYRLLTPAEREAIPLFHAGGVAAAAANWLRWILLEKRDYQGQPNVQSQLEWLLACLKNVS